MSMKTVSIALLQLQAYDRYEFSESWPGVLEEVGRVASQHINVIVLPEVTIPGYVIGTAPLDLTVISDAVARLQALCDLHGCVIVAGLAQADPDGAHGLRNSAVVLCPHRSAQYSSKRFLWHFDNLWFDRGNDLDPIDTPFGKLGIIVCADGRIPIIARTLVERGAELLVVVTAWVTSGRDPELLENIQADLLARVRAWENAIPIVVANKVGSEFESVLYCGKSQAVAADGTMIACASQHSPETVIVELALDSRPAPVRSIPLALAPPQYAERTAIRIAVTRRLTTEQRKVADWCDVDIVISADALPQQTTVLPLLPGNLAGIVLPDDALRDPGYLVDVRLAGYDFFIWQPQTVAAPWIMPLARTRAIELRAYIVVFVSAERLAVIDPQGSIVAGSTAALRMPQFVFDPAQTLATTIVPHTDITQGLAWVRAQQRAS